LQAIARARHHLGLHRVATVLAAAASGADTADVSIAIVLSMEGVKARG
jgi:hypothetical protein